MRHANNDMQKPLMARARFEIELEFIQSLCNPGYLIFLYKSGYFEDPIFVDFLLYLEYFKRPSFRNYLTYPICLSILDSLNDHKNQIFEWLRKGDLSMLNEQLWKLWKNNR